MIPAFTMASSRLGSNSFDWTTMDSSNASSSAASDSKRIGKSMNNNGNISNGMTMMAMMVRQSRTNSMTSFFAIARTRNMATLLIRFHLTHGDMGGFRCEERTPPPSEPTFLPILFGTWASGVFCERHIRFFQGRAVRRFEQ